MLILAPPPPAAETVTSRVRVRAARQLPPRVAPLREPSAAFQVRLASLVLGGLFLAVAGQLTRLAVKSDAMVIVAAAIEQAAESHSRPDIVDRNGRLLATDVEVHSLYADPSRIIDRDEAIEKLATVLPDLDEGEMRKALSDRNKHFAWVRRGLTPKMAQAVHDLGLPGFAFRRELRRAYPLGALAGHMLGRVDADNKGVAGIERYIDDNVGIDDVLTARPTERPPVRLSIEIGAQAGLEAELADAMTRYKAVSAAAVIMDVRSGEIAASASLPRMEPARAADVTDPTKKDRLQTGTYELGSIFKMMTIAAALDSKQVTPETVVDVRTPLMAGRYEIKDLHGAGRPLTVTEIFLHSSNVGSGMLALAGGTSAQQEFLARAGLTTPMATQIGPVTPPVTPARWDRTETITISYGHGIAVAPLQFAAAAGALVNGGTAVAPTYLARRPADPIPPATQVISSETSAAMRTIMRRNVTDAQGTGKRADVPGFDVGGKTGTADIAGPRGYRQGGVISSFLAAFPMSNPRYVALVLLFEPQATAESGGKRLAGLTAAPVAGRIISRIGPLLDR
ncbi:MAG: penicillin-binding protein 2 [Hyphomicrobiaceae bacterium]